MCTASECPVPRTPFFGSPATWKSIRLFKCLSAVAWYTYHKTRGFLAAAWPSWEVDLHKLRIDIKGQLYLEFITIIYFKRFWYYLDLLLKMYTTHALLLSEFCLV